MGAKNRASRSGRHTRFPDSMRVLFSPECPLQAKPMGRRRVEVKRRAVQEPAAITIGLAFRAAMKFSQGMGEPPITPELLVRAYAAGFFPMAERRRDPHIFWVSPEERGIIPLHGFHVPRRLARTVRSDRFQVSTDKSFAAVMSACAASIRGRQETWINDELIRLYCQLHGAGYAHSVECWHEDRLVGGLYGVQLGAAFFGESMFSRERDASKVALVHLVARLLRGGFELLDAQFLTHHLAQFGAAALPRNEYRSEERR